MSDIRDADALARWLDCEPGTEPPSALDPEVVEGILALRPDLAPPLRLTLEDVLATVTEGPFADPAALADAAEQLHQWLAAHPGQAPPASIDPAIVEAAYALRPDLAPAPRLTIDDVLAEVSTGPLAEPAADAPISLDAARKGKRWWAWSGLGVVAMAATVLLFVQPMAHLAEKAPSSARSAKVAHKNAKRSKMKAKSKQRAKRAAKPAADREAVMAKQEMDATGMAASGRADRYEKVAQQQAQLSALEARAQPASMEPAEEAPMRILIGSAASTSTSTGAGTIEDVYAGAPVAAAPGYMPSARPPSPAPADVSRSRAKDKRVASASASSKDLAGPPMDAEDEADDLAETQSRTIEVRMDGASEERGIEIRCGNGYRSRRPVREGRVVFKDVPDSRCALTFFGGTPARYAPVLPGQTLKCSTLEGVATCTAVPSRAR
jgi:hypothetical protein